jgi:formylglycine-generating enzyme
METYICPRCGQNVPGWQTVHLRCLIDRLKWVLIPLAMFSLYVLVSFVGPKVVEVTNSLGEEIANRVPTKITKEVVAMTIATQSSSGIVVTQTKPSAMVPSEMSPTPTQKRVPILSTNTPNPSINFMGKMAFVPGGNYIIGATESEMNWHLNSCDVYASCDKVDFVDMMPRHTVTLSPFYLDFHEVTNAFYKKCVDANVCNYPLQDAIDKYLPSDYFSNVRYKDYPVVAVTWENALKYCEWNGGKRLPTEAEWEAAAGGDEDRFFPWLVRPLSTRARDIFNSESLANYCDFGCPEDPMYWRDSSMKDGYDRTAPVMSFPPGPYGIYDMAGNVSEWVQDVYNKSYYENSVSTNPISIDGSQWRVTRGGGWNSGIYYLSSVFRLAKEPSDAKAFNGFRCAKDH